MSVQWGATPHERKPVPRRSECDGYDETLDDVYGSLRCLVYYVLLPALFTLALLAATAALSLRWS